MDLRETVELALEALQSARSVFNGEGDTCGGCGWCHAPSYGPCEPHCEKDRAVKALRAALSEDVPETNFGNMAKVVDSKESDHIAAANKMVATIRQEVTVEPVAWITPGQELHFSNYEGFQDWVPLYTAPPKREPLTEEQIEFRFGKKPTRYMLFLIRSTERAHGIGGEE